MQPKRSYDDPCGVARALDVVGERWALLVVRELLLGPKRFGALSSGLPGMSQNVLSQRLRELQDAGIVRRRTFGPPASSHGYELTERGRELEPILHALARWGSRIPVSSAAELRAPGNRALTLPAGAPAARRRAAIQASVRPGRVSPHSGAIRASENAAGRRLGAASPAVLLPGALSTDALMLALQTTFDPRAAGALRARLELRIGDDCFHAEIGPRRFGLSRGRAERADAILTASAATLRALVFGDRTIADAADDGDLRIDGDRRVAARFLGCFPRPAAVS